MFFVVLFGLSAPVIPTFIPSGIGQGENHGRDGEEQIIGSKGGRESIKTFFGSLSLTPGQGDRGRGTGSGTAIPKEKRSKYAAQ